jgi:translation initiation factor RLI1
MASDSTFVLSFQEVQNLSGGELQRVAMTLCLGKPADVYLIDEPSAYLDSEQRLVAAKVLDHVVDDVCFIFFWLLIFS